MSFAPLLRAGFCILIVCFGLTGARAQVTPTVCFEPKPETLTRTATADFNTAFNFIDLNQAVPHGFYALVINPGGPTEERLAFIRTSSQTRLHPGALGLPSQPIRFNHLAGETLLLTAEGDAVFGYKNSSSVAVTFTRGSNNNIFAPGNIGYPSQPSVFQPGVQENVVTVKVLAAFPVTWTLDNRQAASNTTQECATITYQGRLSDAGNAANGQFDLQFQAFDAETGGTAQSGSITLENVQVTNGIFTVPLNFGVSLTNNFKARFLEIGVRPGTSTGAFTVLSPRQPITSVPYAVNAQNAVTATTAIIATTTATATNAAQLGGVPAANYLTNTSNFGQNVTTAYGTGSLLINAASGSYTLIPGLTQTINVPANSVLLISTDGGIQSSGAVNTFSVVDVALFVDAASVAQRRIVIGNFPLPGSVGNWALSLGQTLAPGSHTIEVRALNGFGGSANSNVSSGSDPLLRGQLTAAVIRK